MKKIIAASCLAIYSQFIQGQNTNLVTYAEETMSDGQQQINYVRFKESYRVSESETENFINSTVFSSGRNKVSLLSAEKDNLGFTHIRFSIHQDNVLLANRMIIAHCREGKLVSLNGDLNDIGSPLNAFTLTENAALELALKKVNATSYKWQNRAEELHMREVLNQPGFTYYPHGSKMILEKEGKLYSAWMFDIYADKPLYRANVFVDASTGKILEEQNLICHTDVPGTAATRYNGTQTITCDQNGAQFRLREAARGMGIETYNINNGFTYSTSTDFIHTSAAFTLAPFDEGALDAHWGAEKTYDYFFSQHNRNSIDNAGHKLLSYVHYDTFYSNAFWDGQRVSYGDGNGITTILTSLDVCGHEFSHGLTSNSAKLIYNYESGALNESYSDIFGTSIENFARPGNWNWLIGEDLTSNGTPFRNMANPNAMGDPDTYGGTNWYTGSADNGGVHINSGVSNFWFYLLTTGGTGTNDLSNAYTVSGIGITRPAKRAFRALTVDYTPTTNFANARNLSIQAAKDLFGDCSNEMIQTMNAWHAVGVGPKYIAGVVAPNFVSDFTSFCTIPATVHFNNTTGNALTYSWDFGDGSAPATTTNAVHTYTAGGTYNVKLKAVNCANVNDSVTKNSFVVINLPASPVAAPNVSGCEGTSAVLTATGSDIIKWYDNPAATLVVGTGNSFTTPTLTTGKTYYAANTVSNSPVTGGMLALSGGGTVTNTMHSLVFDVVQPCILKSVAVQAAKTGTRIIVLRDASNNVIKSHTVTFLTTSATNVNLNFILVPGNGYRLGFDTGTAGNFYRTNLGVSYPYNIGGCVRISGSTNGNGMYYWFYKWVIQKDDCRSQLMPVTVAINPRPAVTISAAAGVVCAHDDVLLSGDPAGGTFNGSGVTGTSFNASGSGAGQYTVSYTYTDANSCQNTANTVIEADACTGISSTGFEGSTDVFPNPATGSILVRTSALNEGTTITIADAAGRIIYHSPLYTPEQKIDLGAFSEGVYILSLKNSSGKSLRAIKILKQ